MIRPLTTSDIKGLNRLAPANWNYQYETFLNAFRHKSYFHAFVKIEQNVIIGTGNVFTKGPVGWLANIMVDKNHRGKGYGQQMSQFLVDFLQDRGCQTQLLIATELGEAVYKKLNFTRITEYRCFDSEHNANFQPSPNIRKLEAMHWNDVLELDLETNGENRTHLLELSFENGFGYFSDTNELLGFFLPEFGRGLIIARNPDAGLELLQWKHATKGNRTLLPVENKKGIALLKNLGLKEGERSTRMILGREIEWIPEQIYSYGSGYCG